MKITITPSEIIKRCLWNKYDYYILEGKNQEEINKIIEEDKEFIISERDAYIIGLTRCIETPNLSHKLNQNILHVISTRSSEHDLKDGRCVFMIRKNLLEEEINNFLKNFPDSWNKNIVYDREYKKMITYKDELLENIENLSITEVIFRKIKSNYVQIVQVKKLLKQNF